MVTYCSNFPYPPRLVFPTRVPPPPCLLLPSPGIPRCPNPFLVTFLRLGSGDISVRLGPGRGVTSDDRGRHRPRGADDLHRLRQPDGHQHLRAGGCTNSGRLKAYHAYTYIYIQPDEQNAHGLGRTDFMTNKIRQASKALLLCTPCITRAYIIYTYVCMYE